MTDDEARELGLRALAAGFPTGESPAHSLVAALEAARGE